MAEEAAQKLTHITQKLIAIFLPLLCGVGWFVGKTRCFCGGMNRRR